MESCGAFEKGGRFRTRFPDTQAFDIGSSEICAGKDRFPDGPEGRRAAADARRRMTAFGIGPSVRRWLGRVECSRCSRFIACIVPHVKA